LHHFSRDLVDEGFVLGVSALNVFVGILSGQGSFLVVIKLLEVGFDIILGAAFQSGLEEWLGLLPDLVSAIAVSLFVVIEDFAEIRVQSVVLLEALRDVWLLVDSHSSPEIPSGILCSGVVWELCGLKF
jgi:hypothetical protein